MTQSIRDSVLALREGLATEPGLSALSSLVFVVLCLVLGNEVPRDLERVGTGTSGTG